MKYEQDLFASLQIDLDERMKILTQTCWTAQDATFKDFLTVYSTGQQNFCSSDPERWFLNN